MQEIFLESHHINNLNFGFGQFNYHLLKAIAKTKTNDFKFEMYASNTSEFEKEFNNFYSVKKYYSFHRYNALRIRKKYDLWHSLNQNSKIEPYYNDIPYLLTIHNISHIVDQNNYKNLPNHISFQNKINRSKALVYISEYAKSSTHEFFDVPNVPEYVVYNGNTIEKMEIPENFNSSINIVKPYFFSIGEITARKNFLSIVKMMSFFPEYDLYIAGKNSTSEAQKIYEYISKNKVSNVKLLGKISEIEKQYLYENSLGLLFPSLREGFGLPIIEAMTFGKPCFLSNNTCLPEIGGKDSFYWDNFDIEHMAEVVKKGLQTIKNQPTLVENYKQRASLFNWNNAATDYLKIYKEIL